MIENVSTQIFKEWNPASFEKQTARCAAAKARLAVKEAKEEEVGLIEAEPVFIPGRTEKRLVVPTCLAASNMFSANGDHKHVDKELLTSRSNVSLLYTGKRLDMADHGLYVVLLNMAITQPLGAVITVSGAELLQRLGLPDGGEQYKWLSTSFERLFGAYFEIEIRRADGSRKVENSFVRLIQELKKESSTNSVEFTFSIHSCWRDMLIAEESSLIDWAKRVRLKARSKMAYQLMSIIAATGDVVQRNRIELLMRQTRYMSPISKFRVALSKAMKELEDVGVIMEPEINISTKGHEQAVWTKVKDGYL